MISLTGLVITFDEEANIGRCLEQLKWIERVVVLDSFSSDRTREIAREFRNVDLIEREFQSFATQCNFGLSQITTEWVLSLDADYILSDELISEIQTLDPSPSTAGYSADFRYCISGRPLRSTLYPARTVLYQRRLAKYRDEGHGHRVSVNGRVGKLSAKIDHDDRKSFRRWIRSQDIYARAEAQYLRSTPFRELNFQDRLRRCIFFAPPAVFLFLLFARGLVLDGWAGWFYVCQRTIAESLLSVRLLMQRH